MNPRNLHCHRLVTIVLSVLLLHLPLSPRILAQQDPSRPTTMIRPSQSKLDDTTLSDRTNMDNEPPGETEAIQVVASDGPPLSSGAHKNLFYLPIIFPAASNNSCDYVLSPSSVIYYGNSTPPGSVICLQAGTYDGVVFRNLRGTAENPITITNLDGQVRVTGPRLEIRNCQHVHLSGAGAPEIEYGIHADRAWVHVYEKLADIEIDHIEISNQRLSVDEPYDPDHETTDIHIHDNYLHCSPGGYPSTVMYIGRAHYDQHPGQYVMRRVEIDHNIFDGADGRALKVSGIVEDCNVHHNWINDALRRPQNTLREAVAIVHGCAIDFHSNIIQQCPGYGVSIDETYFSHYIYNNLIVNTGQGGEYQDALITWQGNSHVFNNTIVGARRHGIAFSRWTDNSFAFNNVILDTGGDPIRQDMSPSSNFHHNHTKDDGYTQLNYGFADPTNGDFHLTSACGGLDAGANSGLVSDLDDTPRPMGTRYDIGCYEHNPNELPPRP
jgi:hypothetical protein